jgi:hypothetical protein
LYCCFVETALPSANTSEGALQKCLATTRFTTVSVFGANAQPLGISAYEDWHEITQASTETSASVLYKAPPTSSTLARPKQLVAPVTALPGQDEQAVEPAKAENVFLGHCMHMLAETIPATAE